MRAEREKNISPLRRSLALLGIRGGAFGVMVVVGGGCCEGGCWAVLLLSVVGVVVDDDGFPSGKSHRLRSQDILASSLFKRIAVEYFKCYGDRKKTCLAQVRKKSSDSVGQLAFLPRIMSRAVSALSSP